MVMPVSLCYSHRAGVYVTGMFGAGVCYRGLGVGRTIGRAVDGYELVRVRSRGCNLDVAGANYVAPQMLLVKGCGFS